jgi:hypothetical protein
MPPVRHKVSAGRPVAIDEITRTVNNAVNNARWTADAKSYPQSHR